MYRYIYAHSFDPDSLVAVSHLVHVRHPARRTGRNAVTLYSPVSP